MKRPGLLVLVSVCLSASTLAGCKPAVEGCEFVELTTDELDELGLAPEDVLAEFAAAPTPTLTWLDPPVLEEGWGLAAQSNGRSGSANSAKDVMTASFAAVGEGPGRGRHSPCACWQWVVG